MIDPNTISRIFETARIDEVVSDFISLRKRGVNYLGLCPFHNEKTPSFTVSPAKGIYKCFGCGKGGNSVNFIMEHEHLDYVGALKYLAKKYNIDIVEEELSPEQEKQRNDRESMMVVNNFAQKTFIENLHQHPQGIAVGLTYFKERGFRADIIKKFQLGFCLDEWEAFSSKAIDSGYKKEYLIRTGLSIDKNNRLIDRFKGRVIFPIHGIAGRVLAFGGRTLKTDKKIAKYLNSPESEVYHKSKVLYGIYQAKKTIIQNDKCYLVEGYTDVLSFHQSGIENVVASSGTALTADQIRLIKRFTNNVTIIYDGDAAGIKASLRGIDLVLEQELNVKVLLLPEGEDPDSFSRTMGATQLTEYIQRNETDFIVFKTNLLLDDAKGDPIKRANLVIDIVRSIAIIPSSVIRAEYVKECSKLLKTDERILYNEINKIIHKRKTDTWKQQQRSEFHPSTSAEVQQPNLAIRQTSNICDTEERALLRILLNFGEKPMQKSDDEEPQQTIMQFIINELQTDELESENNLYQTVFDELATHLNTPDFKAKVYFRDHNNPAISQLAADILSEPYQLSKLWQYGLSKVETETNNEDNKYRLSNKEKEIEQKRLYEMVPKLVNEYKSKKVRILIKEKMQQILKAQETGNSDLLIELLQEKKILDDINQEILKHLGNRTII